MTMIIMLVHHGMVGIERTSTITSAIWTTGIVRFATGVEVIKARPARSNLYNHFWMAKRSVMRLLLVMAGCLKLKLLWLIELRQDFGTNVGACRKALGQRMAQTLLLLFPESSLLGGCQERFNTWSVHPSVNDLRWNQKQNIDIISQRSNPLIRKRMSTFL